jgi:BirA family biotin operon repressor/biotin-[acetyl-CoA-carboxylase] ligase
MIGRPLYRFDAVTSTQDLVLRLAELGAPEGTTVVAGYQSGGRGRAGRSWTTRRGEALLLSILLRPSVPAERFSVFSLLVGDAIATILERSFDLRPAVKWPNDVMLNARKVSGVLITTRSQPGGGPRTAAVGIGINLNSSADHLPPGATSVVAETGSPVDLDAVRFALLQEIDQRYTSLNADDIDQYVHQMNRRLFLRGDQVSVDDAGRIVAGRLQAVERDGSLLLYTSEGIRRVVSGEMTRGPRAMGR